MFRLKIKLSLMTCQYEYVLLTQTHPRLIPERAWRQVFLITFKPLTANLGGWEGYIDQFRNMDTIRGPPLT